MSTKRIRRMVPNNNPADSHTIAIRIGIGPSSYSAPARLRSWKPRERGLSRRSRCEKIITAGMAIQLAGCTARSFQMYAMMRPNNSSGSSRASLRMAASEEEMLGPIHQHVQGRGGENRGSLPENRAVCHAGDGGQNHVPPVGQGLRSVVQVSAAENECGGQQRPGIRAEAQHQQVLDQRTEEDLLRQRRADEKKA